MSLLRAVPWESSGKGIYSGPGGQEGLPGETAHSAEPPGGSTHIPMNRDVWGTNTPSRGSRPGAKAL